MSSVGSVGGAGAAAGVSVAAGAGASNAVTPSPGVAESGDFSGSNVDAVEAISSSDSESSKAAHASPMGAQGSSMSTQNFISLHNTAVTQINESSGCQEIDLKKLIEMMMAIKLLEAMNDNK